MDLEVSIHLCFEFTLNQDLLSCLFSIIRCECFSTTSYFPTILKYYSRSSHVILHLKCLIKLVAAHPLTASHVLVRFVTPLRCLQHVPSAEQAPFAGRSQSPARAHSL